MIKRHTVLLGAGATMAAIPNGDKNGQKSSVMNNLFSELGMDYILKNVDLHTSSKNLEDIYSELASRPECKDVVQVIEKSLYDYFASLELPDYPTIYDYLILSLTGKDVIATFNWDPLLIQAYKDVIPIDLLQIFPISSAYTVIPILVIAKKMLNTAHVTQNVLSVINRLCQPDYYIL